VSATLHTRLHTRKSTSTPPVVRPTNCVSHNREKQSALQAAVASLRRAGRTSAAKLGKEDQARRLLGHIREVRDGFDPSWRRETLDAHAVRMVLAVALHTDSNAIDVGANEGAVLRQICALAPAGRHIAFEPIPDLGAGLREQFPRVDVRGMAVSNEAGSADVAYVADAPAYSGLRERSDLPSGSGHVEHIEVRTERLDDILAEDYVPALIKIDVEGAELQVMQGAIQTLQLHRPFVLFEHGIGGADIYGTDPKEVFDLLDSAGLRIFDLDGDGPYGRERFEATFTEPIWNFLATPT
jgi:FkbM family methyltransferase